MGSRKIVSGKVKCVALVLGIVMFFIGAKEVIRPPLVPLHHVLIFSCYEGLGFVEPSSGNSKVICLSKSDGRPFKLTELGIDSGIIVLWDHEGDELLAIDGNGIKMVPTNSNLRISSLFSVRENSISVKCLDGKIVKITLTKKLVGQPEQIKGYLQRSGNDYVGSSTDGIRRIRVRALPFSLGYLWRVWLGGNSLPYRLPASLHPPGDTIASVRVSYFQELALNLRKFSLRNIEVRPIVDF